MDYLLDTNIVVYLVRNGNKGREIEEALNLFSPNQDVFIAAVTKGEVLSLAKQYLWGAQKIARLKHVLNKLICIPLLGDSPILDAYSDLDAYSQGKHPEYMSPPGFTSRNMGKNDLWIAATAFLLDVALVTTDFDFDHLHPNFIQVVKV
jgi:tRNA(fMet)-specific endonuclease VapC